MPLPKPEPGLVIPYAYLWRDQQAAGQAEGIKDRPCAIVVAVQDASGVMHVTVAPITSRPPAEPAAAVEIDAAIKRHLGLDPGTPSWIIAAELNRFA